MSSRLERKDKLQKRKQIIKYTIIVLTTIAIIALVYKVGQNLFVLYNENQRETAVLQYGCLEDEFQGDGIVLRSEKTISAPANGRFENTVAENERVRRQDLLGYFISAGNKIPIRTSESGIYTSQVDGLEKALQDIKLQAVGPEIFKYRLQTADPGAEIKKGQNFCKIVNNLMPARLMLRFPLEKGDDLQVKKAQELQLYVDGKGLGTFTVQDYKRDFNSFLMLVKADEFRENLLNKRFVKVKIGLNSQRGYIVPEKSLINRGKEKGIYCTKSEVVVFRPVKVLKIKNDKAVVEGLNPTDIIIVNPGVIHGTP